MLSNPYTVQFAFEIKAPMPDSKSRKVWHMVASRNNGSNDVLNVTCQVGDISFVDLYVRDSGGFRWVTYVEGAGRHPVAALVEVYLSENPLPIVGKL